MSAPAAAAPPPPPAATGSGGRVLRAVAWGGLATAGSALFTLARQVVLGRLLSPAEFGLFSLVQVCLMALTTFTEVGLLRAALVLRFDSDDERRRFLDTAFTVQLLRSLGLWLLLGLASLPLAAFFSAPRLVLLLSAGGLSTVLYSLSSPGLTLLQLRFDQRRLGLLRLCSEGAGLLVTALLSFWLRSAMGLVLGLNAAALISALGSYLAAPHRPRLALDRRHLSRGFAQGRHVGLVGALTFVTTQVDNLVVGRLAGPAALGLYQFAYRLCSLPVEQVQGVAFGVALPAYSQARHQDPALAVPPLRRILTAGTAGLVLLLLPALLLRRELVSLLGGQRWIEAAALLPPLFLLAVLRSTTAHHGTFLQGMERAEVDSRSKVVEAALFIPGCVVAVQRFGLLGACWTGVTTYTIGLLLRVFAVRSVVGPGNAVVVRAWAVPLALGLSCAGVGLWLETRGTLPLLVAPLLTAAFGLLALWLCPGLGHELERVRRRLAGRLPY